MSPLRYYAAQLDAGEPKAIARLRRTLREHGTIEHAAVALGFSCGRALRRKGERNPHIRKVLELVPTIRKKTC